MRELPRLLASSTFVDPTQPLGPESARSAGSRIEPNDAATLLVDHGVTRLGVDTLSPDPGDTVDLPDHHTMFPAGIWQLEGSAALERVPARGARLVAAALRLVDGSGTPARVFAIVPAHA